MKPDNPERLNFFQRTGRQFDSVGPLGKALLVATIIPFGAAQAQDKATGNELRAMNNFVHEHVVCAAFYAISSQCLKSRSDSAELSANMQKLSETAYKRGIEYGDAIKLSRKTHPARLEMAMNSMMADMSKDCINISVILNAHAYACKRLMDQPEEALDRFLTGKPLKD